MSILFSSAEGWLISHENLMNSIYRNVENTDGNISAYKISDILFKIAVPFGKLKHNLKRKHCNDETENESDKQLEETINHIKNVYQNFRLKIHPLLCSVVSETCNEEAIKLSQNIYDNSEKAHANTIGENLNRARFIRIDGNRYLFPKNCKFYCKNVASIKSYLTDNRYDIILLDPPWWNKYIRRKRMKTNHGYEMMYNDHLRDIPVEDLLKDDGFVVVWCTNSKQHFQALCGSIFSKWKVHSVARLFWVKITQSGEPVCKFSQPPGKQPFEQIIIASRNPQSKLKCLNGKLIVSIPSALHSHKPPLTEILNEYLPENPSCLELFARYLLPNWTSWGLEAIRFQHESLYLPIELKVSENTLTSSE